MTVMRSQTAIFSKRVRDVMRGAPPLIAAATPVSAVVATMVAAPSSAALVVGADERIMGIVTEQDVLRRVAFKASEDSAIENFVTRPVLTVPVDEYLYRAVVRLRRHGLRHMPVVDDGGRPVGMIDLHEALGYSAEQMMRQIDRLTREDTTSGMVEVKRAQVELAAELLADNLPAPEIQALLTDINRDIHCRVLEAAIDEMASSGWGAPPVAFSLLIMGSGGRGENFLAPDQDNGFMLADYPDEDHPRIDTYFIALAERFTRGLNAVGFPFCEGNVMATNPVWRKTSSQWQHQISLWASRRSPVAVLFADIFFDFRTAWGPAEPVAALRDHVSRTIRAYPAFVAQMCDTGTDHDVALGLFGRLTTTQKTGPHSGHIDLKAHGTFPLVASARLWALQAGIAATATLERVAALGQAGTLDANEVEELTAAFSHVTYLMLRQQLADVQSGNPASNYVDPKTLTKRERNLLVGSLKAIGSLRTRTRAHFTGQLF